MSKGKGWDFAATLLALLLHARAERPSHRTDTVQSMLLKFARLCKTKESEDWKFSSNEIRQIFRVAIRLATQEPQIRRNVLVYTLIIPSLIRACVCLRKSDREIYVCA